MGLRDRLRRRPPAVAAAVLDGDDLVVVVEAFEASRADSAVLAEAAERGVDLSVALLIRHHLLLPHEESVTEAAALLDPGGYRVLAGAGPGGVWKVRASREQLLTTLGVAQERSRMAGLAQRLGGDALGWDAARRPEGQ